MLNLHLLECTVKGYDHISDLLLAKYWVITGCKYSGCTALAKVNLPNSVTNIGKYAFSNCDNLAEIYLLASTPASVRSNSFSRTHYASAQLIVPEGALSAYQQNASWGKFENIRESAMTGMEDASVAAFAVVATDNGLAIADAEGQTISIYAMNGTLVAKIEDYAGEEIVLNPGSFMLLLLFNFFVVLYVIKEKRLSLSILKKTNLIKLKFPLSL